MAPSILPLATDSWDDAEYAAIQKIVKSRTFTMGKHVKAFEDEFAAFFNAKYAVMVNSGSSANLIAIAGMFFHPDSPLKRGDEVIVPAVSWSTTYFPLQQYGLKLRFVDIDRDTLNLDLDQLQAAITSQTKAIFAVNLLGNPIDLPRLKAFCTKHALMLFEDNCESMGAKIDGRHAGTFGVFGTYSTFFSHHISTMEGGVVTTDDKKFYDILLSMRAHGWVRDQPDDSHLDMIEDPFMRQFRFVLPGYNVRPLEMSGAIGSAQLKKVPMLIRERRANAKLFLAACNNIPGFRLQKEIGESSWFGFAIVLEDHLSGKRAALVQVLTEAGIDSRPIVAGNFLNNPAIKYLDYSLGSDLPNADYIDENGIFVGNHHYPLPREIGALADILQAFSLRHM